MCCRPSRVRRDCLRATNQPLAQSFTAKPPRLEWFGRLSTATCGVSGLVHEPDRHLATVARIRETRDRQLLPFELPSPLFALMQDEPRFNPLLRLLPTATISWSCNVYDLIPILFLEIVLGVVTPFAHRSLRDKGLKGNARPPVGTVRVAEPVVRVDAERAEV